MSAPPRVSILVPLYNSAATLERCLRSAMAQTLPDIEILVADDASTDAGADLAERLAREDPRIRVVSLSPNRGKSHAMNRMTALATGTWLAVLDADDAYRPDRLAALLDAAEAHGTELAADNLAYRDAGIDQIVRTGFDPAQDTRILGLPDLVATANSFAGFDYGILKPLIRRDFVIRHRLAYFEDTRLAEDFYYLLAAFVAGARCVLLPRPLYVWTMPFGMVSRQWTQAGAGAWRYDYRDALRANAHALAAMQDRGEHAVVAMLRRRGRQYRVMVRYIDAQKHLADGRHGRALLGIAAHPSAWGLLLVRLWGRLRRAAARATPLPEPGG